MTLSRRLLITSGAAAAALVGLGVKEGVLPEPRVGGTVLSAGEAHLVVSLGNALFPPGNPLGVAAGDVDLPAAIDELLGETLDGEIRLVFRYFLRALDEGTRISRGTGFGSLSLEEQRAVLATWSHNDVPPRRLIHDMFRLVMGMAYFNQPQVIAAVGWRAECAVGTA